MLDVENNNQLSETTFKNYIGNVHERTKSTNPQSDDYQIIKNIDSHLANLEYAFKHLTGLAEKRKIASSGVEWFLDNYYVILKTIELIRDDLPKAYFSRLPSIKQKPDIPRIYQIARSAISYYEIELIQNDLDDFLNAYQDETPLQMSELWALPLMLRLVLIEVLSNKIFELVDDHDQVIKTPYIDFSDIDTNEVVARILRTMLLFDRLDWKGFIEKHSIVDRILEEDPVSVYQKMDFESRDQYRKIIEMLAERSSCSEAEVAHSSVELACQVKKDVEREKHVGFYLVDRGITKLKSSINYQESFLGKLRKFFFDQNSFFYLGGIGIITLSVVFGLIMISQLFISSHWPLLLLGFLMLIPASSVAVNLVNSIITAVLPPHSLPKMDFREGIPKQFRSVVTIPALLTTNEEVSFLTNQLELHYLANKQQNIGFVLLTDYSDAEQETMPEDEGLLKLAIEKIEDLNERYSGDHGRKPFYLFHRRRQWNENEDTWMGWERKRGKLADFNRFLLEGFQDSFDTIIGEVAFLSDIRFVITVDADTVLPRDSAIDLIATLAHPLNQAEFQEGTSNVTSGYTILQPRTEVKPTSVNKSLFTRVFAGDMGLDLYTRAVSNVYQDLFHEGIYVGKGIYDLEAFQRSIEEKVPDNALLSHDLFEGLLGRAGLVSDIVFFEDYPPDYSSQVNRLHRWVRGDWQLLPWLLPRVPNRKQEYEKNPFSIIDRWKILDNLRRSLLAPTMLISLLAGWFIFRDKAWIWSLIILIVSAFPLFNHIVTSLVSKSLIGAMTNLLINIRSALLRWIFWLVFLPFEALIMSDAIVTSLIRTYISHKRMLQWQTSAHTIRIFGKQRNITIIWKRMFGAPIISFVSAILLFIYDKTILWPGLPLLLIWLFSPQIAYWISMEEDKDKKQILEKGDLSILRSLARRTWLFFEHFVGPEDHWLPPDHFQEDPKGEVAHRPSPTNIGLLMLSSACAYDFGYIGALDFVYRTNYIFNTLDGMEKYRGHLFNWYDTRNLETLKPRYISTVDSGNYAMCLIGLYQTLKELPEHIICPQNLFQGCFDSFEVFCSVINRIKSKELIQSIQKLNDHCAEMELDINCSQLTDSKQLRLLSAFETTLSEPMSILIKEIFADDKIIDPQILQDLHLWTDAFFQHLENIQQQIKILAPWMNTWRNRPGFFDQIRDQTLKKIFSTWYEDQSLQMPLSGLAELCGEKVKQINNYLGKTDQQDLSSLDDEQKKQLENWLNEFTENLQESKNNVIDLLDRSNNLQKKIDFYLERMEFNFLFDKQREVFYLGYQVESGKLDKNHYDLLASEARTASLFAISQNEVPRSHWLHMARPFTSIKGIPTLVSWNGSMFEYLMPNLYNKVYPGTLLHQTSKGAVAAQMDYGNQINVPWGISESSYYRFDQADNYQYKGFGIPSLGRKRGLANDLVIAPYASLMAIDLNPKAVLKNISALNSEGAMGHFGFYESIDYTKSRLPVGQDKAVIKSYMAHHQGMLFISLANFLNQRKIVDRVHGDPRIQSTELLLQEHIPDTKTKQMTKEAQASERGMDMEGITVSPWPVDTDQPGRSVHVLSNGSMRMLMTDSGSGYLEWRDIALTRWREDNTFDSWGIWFYVQDLDQEKSWSIGRQPIRKNPDEYQVIFAPHMTEIRRVNEDLKMIMQTTIMPNDDICLHKITITNQTDQKRHFRILSYGEVVLAPQDTDQQHPAFNKLFIESDYDHDLKMLTYRRRKRSSDEAPLGMAHLVYDDLPGEVEYESARDKFIGRAHDVSNPITIEKNHPLSKTAGITLDPIFSLGKHATLEPNQAATITFMTLGVESKKEARTLAGQLRNETRIENAFTSARAHSEQILRALALESEKLSLYQLLLSRIIYPISGLRAEPSLLAKNVLGQSGLWPFGVSGDYPILCLMIDSKDKIEDVQEVLLAHTYWRKMGMMIDLVILNTKDEGYTHELNDKIHQAINVMDSQSWVNRRGGIFVITASQLDQNNLILLKAAASVLLDFITGDLDQQLREPVVFDPDLPSFIPTGAEKEFSSGKALQRPQDLIMDNEMGGLSPDGKEYQIFLQDYPKSTKGVGQITPVPWSNVIANENFGFLITESGGGYTWAINSGENRLTPWTNDPVSDPVGESLYLRDEITGNIWSPTPQPAGAGSDYLVRHGQGYSVFESFNNGFKQEMRVFTDEEAPVKIIELTLINQTDEHRRLTGTYVAEWVLSSNRSRMSPFIIPRYDNQSGSLLARNSYSAEFSNHVAFLTSDLPVHGITTDRREFFGSPGNRQAPAGLKRIGLSGQVKAGMDPCAALQTHINFNANEKKTVTFILGQGSDESEAKHLAEKFSKKENFKTSWDKAKKAWESRLSSLQVTTPEPSLDMMINRWLPYQTLSSRIWGRSGFFQSSGAYGYRDQLQDVVSILAIKPEESKAHILRAARHQFEEGDVLHWWQPPSGRGVRTRITDDLLWLVYVTYEYVTKTGDASILEEKVPFLVGDPLEDEEEQRYELYGTSEDDYSIFEHCQRALEYGDTEGPRGLPRIGSGDWNDGMNRVGIGGQGESVWLGWFIYENHKRFAELCDLMNKPDLAQKHRDRAKALSQTINTVAWEENQFLRGFYDDGTPLGSKKNKECKIDSLPQSWSVMTQGAPEDRQKKAIQSVEKHLVDQEARIIKLFTPPFDETKHDPGYIKGYPPGVRENGGQYTHAAVWAVWAQTVLGQGNKAFDQFMFLNPLTHSQDIDAANLYSVEPYCVAADVYSTSPFTGRGGWTWYTGSSGWLYRLGTEAMLGFQMKGDHFAINPCIPSEWAGYQMVFRKDGSTYHIKVKNPEGVEHGVKQIYLDGEELQENRIPLNNNPSEHEIVVVMG